MIRNITARKVKAVTSQDFFTRLCHALPNEFHHSAENETHIHGYYKDKFELDCFKVEQPGVYAENYLFVMTEAPDNTTPAALSNFFNDVRRVAEKAGYEEVATRSAMFSDSYCLIKEAANKFRLLVKN